MTTLLRLPVVIERTGLSRSRIYELIAAGEFPEPIKHSERVNVWPDTEVEAWIGKRLAERAARAN